MHVGALTGRYTIKSDVTTHSAAGAVSVCRVLMKWVSLIAGTLVSGAFCVYAHMPNSSQTLAKLLHLDQQRCGVDLGPPPRGHLDHNVLDQASSNERQ